MSGCLRWGAARHKLTPVEGKGNGESFCQFPVIAGGYYLADRGYSAPSGIRHVTENGAHLAVRLNPDGVRLLSIDGQLFPLIDKLQTLSKPGLIAEWDITIADSADRLAAVGRLCVIRKTDEAFQVAKAKLERKAQKNNTTLRPKPWNMRNSSWFSRPSRRNRSLRRGSWIGIGCAGKSNWFSSGSSKSPNWDTFQNTTPKAPRPGFMESLWWPF